MNWYPKRMFWFDYHIEAYPGTRDRYHFREFIYTDNKPNLIQRILKAEWLL